MYVYKIDDKNKLVLTESFGSYFFKTQVDIYDIKYNPVGNYIYALDF